MLGPVILAEEARLIGARFIHVSSGCIFTGRDVPENAQPNPLSRYAQSKAAAEAALHTLPVVLLPGVSIVRIRMPVYHIPHARDLVSKLIGYSQVLGDELNSITDLRDLASALIYIIKEGRTGIFHAVNPGAVTHREILELYREICDPSHTNTWLTLAQLDTITKAKRSNATLQNNRLPMMRPALVALRDCLESRARFMEVERRHAK